MYFIAGYRSYFNATVCLSAHSSTRTVIFGMSVCIMFLLSVDIHMCALLLHICSRAPIHASLPPAEEVALLLLPDDKWQLQEQISLQEFFALQNSSGEHSETPHWPDTHCSLCPVCFFCLPLSLFHSQFFPVSFSYLLHFCPPLTSAHLSPLWSVIEKRPLETLLTVGSTPVLAPASRRSPHPRPSHQRFKKGVLLLPLFRQCHEQRERREI